MRLAPLRRPQIADRVIKAIAPWLAALVIVLALGWVGEMDYEVERAMQQSQQHQTAAREAWR